MFSGGGEAYPCRVPAASSTLASKQQATAARACTAGRWGHVQVADNAGSGNGGRAPGAGARCAGGFCGGGGGEAARRRGGANREATVAGSAAGSSPASGSELANVSGFPALRQVAGAGSFEGQTDIGVGVRTRLPF